MCDRRRTTRFKSWLWSLYDFDNTDIIICMWCDRLLWSGSCQAILMQKEGAS